MNKQIAALSVFFLLLLSFSIVGSSFAQTQAVPGVSVGDKFTYNNNYLWNSTNPADVVPAYLVAQNQSILQVTVQQVTGSTAVLEKVWTYKNGTQQSDSETDEVNGGITGTVLQYAANLTAGGLLFPGSTSLTYVINDSSFRDYSGSFRETNHIQVNNTGDENLAYSFINLYFDKQTGVLVEYFLTDVSTATPNQMVTQHLLITESTIWTIPEFPPTVILPVILIVATLTLVLSKKRHKRNLSNNSILKP